MRKVKLEEFIHLPEGHLYSNDAERHLGVKVRDQQYTDDAGIPRNDWVDTSFMGEHLREHGCWQDDESDTIDQTSTPSDSRYALYPEKDSVYEVYTDADTAMMIAVMLAGMRKLYAIGEENWGKFYTSLVGQIAWEIQHNCTMSEDTTTAVNRQYTRNMRRLLIWLLQNAGTLTCDDLVAAGAACNERVGWKSNPSFVARHVINDNMEAFFAVRNIPDIPDRTEELQKLYTATRPKGSSWWM